MTILGTHYVLDYDAVDKVGGIQPKLGSFIQQQSLEVNH